MAERDLQGELDQLRRDIAKSQEDVKRFAEEGNEQVGSLRERLINEAKRLEERLEERLETTLGSARQGGEESLGALTGQVRQHPLMSLAVAVGVGFLLGFVVRQR